MKNKFILLLLPLSISFVQAFASYEELRKIAREEFTLLTHLAGIQPILAFDESPNSYSSALRKEGRITISLFELNAMVGATEGRFQRNIVRMVIAHEFGHLLQYLHQGPQSIGLIGECQADLISGFLLYQLIFKDVASRKIDYDSLQDKNENQDAQNLTLYENLLILYGTIFKLGDDFSIFNSHPRGMERMTAIRLGMEWGSLWLADFQAKDLSLPATVRVQQRKIVAKKKYSLGFLLDDNIVKWSYRTAKKIVHEDLNICKDIIADEELKWNTSAKNPFVFYTQHIRNIGTRRITVNFFNQLYYKNRKDPKNLLLWDLQNSSPKMVTLEPGESISIKDSLQWFSTKRDMPGFVGLSHEYGLYTCRVLKRKPEINRQAAPDRFTGRKQNTLAEIWGILLSYVPGRLSNLIAGVGQSVMNNPDEVNYPSLVRYPDAESTEIIHSLKDKSYLLMVSVCNECTKADSQEKLYTLINALEENGKIVKPVVSNDKVSVYEIDRKGESLLGRIDYFRSSKNGFGFYFVIFNSYTSSSSH